MRVLLIEDDRSTARNVELTLLNQDFVVEVAHDGESGLELAEVYDFDLILLDLDLPDMTGVEVLRELRAAGRLTPVLMLTGTSGVDAKVKAFSAGADDYLVKPFHKDELVARVRAVIRRSRGIAQSVLTIGDLSIDLDSKLVHVDGALVHLTGREYQTLELLALRRGKTLTKDAFLESLYGGMDEPGAKIVDVFICKLRRKLTDARCQTRIETIWGGGYLLRDPAQPAVATAA